MVRIILSVLVALVIIVVSGDTARNIPSFSIVGFMIRVLPLLVLLVIALADMLLGSEWDIILRFSSYLLLADVMTINSASPFDEPSLSELFSPIAVVSLALLVLAGNRGFYSDVGYDILSIAVPAILLVQGFLCRRRKLNVIRIEQYLALDLAAAFGFVAHVRNMDDCLWCAIPLNSVLLGWLAYLLLKKYPGGFYMFPARKNHRDEPCPEPHGDAPDEFSRMDELFDRLEKYMKETEPFLDETLSLADLSTAMLTNKTYLSRTINYKSGMHFRPYVNKYRVEHSLKIMQKDRRVKVMELAVLSGFHSVATYNMAFRLFVGDTPSEYMRTLSAKELYSSSKPFQDEGTGAKI